MVEDQFTDIAGQVTNLSLQIDANELVVQAITDIEDDILELRGDLSILTSIDTRILTLDVDNLMFVDSGILTQLTVDEEGIEIIKNITELTLDGLLNVKKIVAEEVISEKFVAKGSDDASISGTGVICRDGEIYFEDSCIEGTDEDVSDGISVVVNTEAISNNSRIMVTSKKPVAIGVTDVVENEGFTVSVESEVENDLVFDWFIIDSE